MALNSCHSAAYSIAVSGNDVYVAGEVDSIPGVPIATYWKNGNPVFLNGGTNFIPTSIAVSGNNVCVAGETAVTDFAATYCFNITCLCY